MVSLSLKPNLAWTDFVLIVVFTVLAFVATTQIGQLGQGAQINFNIGLIYVVAGVFTLLLFSLGFTKIAFFDYFGTNIRNSPLALVVNQTKLNKFVAITLFFIIGIGLGAISTTLIKDEFGLKVGLPASVSPIANFIFVTIIAPIIETYFWFATLMISLEGLIVWLFVRRGGTFAKQPLLIIIPAAIFAVLFIAAIFAVWHFVATANANLPLSAIGFLFGLGIIFGGLTRLTGNIWAAVAAHLVVNLLADTFLKGLLLGGS